MILYTRKQYLDYLREKRRVLFIDHTEKKAANEVVMPKDSISIHDFSNPEKPTYDRKFMRLVLSGMKFGGISHDNHDITKKQLEALINFFQVCSWTDFYIVLKLSPYMPIIIILLQIFQFIAIIGRFTKL